MAPKSEHMRYCTNLKCKEFQIPQIFSKGKTCAACGQRTQYLRPGDDLPPQEFIDGTQGLILLSSASNLPCTWCNDPKSEHIEHQGQWWCTKGTSATTYQPISLDSDHDLPNETKPMMPIGWQHSLHPCINCDAIASEHEVDGVCPTSDHDHVTWFEDSFSRNPTGTAAYLSHTSQPSKPAPNQPLVLSSNCDLKDCPIAPTGLRVDVPFSLYQKWVFLAGHFNIEWIAYLTGRLIPATTDTDGKSEPAHYELDEDGMYFPQQMATGAHVDAERLSEGERPNTIASIHSHVQMAAFFSGTDEQHFSHDIELVVNAMGKMDCVTRTRLECGRYQRVKSKVDITAASPLTTVLKDLKSKLVAYSLTSYSQPPNSKTIGPKKPLVISAFDAAKSGPAKDYVDERDKILDEPGVQMALRYIARRFSPTITTK